jgi:hypothetical protein
MKKLSFLMILVIGFMLSACGGGGVENPPDQNITGGDQNITGGDQNITEVPTDLGLDRPASLK